MTMTREIVELLTDSWKLLANVDDGSWDKQSVYWKFRAEEFRDDYFSLIEGEEWPEL